MRLKRRHVIEHCCCFEGVSLWIEPRFCSLSADSKQSIGLIMELPRTCPCNIAFDIVQQGQVEQRSPGMAFNVPQFLFGTTSHSLGKEKSISPCSRVLPNHTSTRRSILRRSIPETRPSQETPEEGSLRPCARIHPGKWTLLLHPLQPPR